MTRSFALGLFAVALGAYSGARGAEAPVAASIETSLATAEGHIRQFAFDGNLDTYFRSSQNPTKTDHFTLVFDKLVALKAVTVSTGKPKNGGDRLEVGVLEISADGQSFREAAKFADGAVKVQADGKKVRAVRIKLTEDQMHPLAIREFEVVSEPPVAVFKYPVEFVLDVADAPEMKEWVEKVAGICERQYPMICEELRSEGFKPATVITMSFKNSYNGVAATSGDRVTGSVKWFKDHPDDMGAMVHETVHVVQQYHRGNDPGWLVEGIADYIRFFKYEAKKPKPLSPSQAKYNGSYRVSAAFLDFLTEKYDKQIVTKLNKALREGDYKDELFKSLTKKALPELAEEWKESLGK